MTPLRVAAILVAICAVAFWQLGQIGQSAIQMLVGPAAVPKAMVALLCIVTALYAFTAWQGKQIDESSEPDQSALPGSGQRLASVIGGGVVFIAGVTWLGFVAPATACGMLIARAFDAPFGAKSALICACISTALWVIFAKVLGVGLGPATPFGF